MQENLIQLAVLRNTDDEEADQSLRVSQFAEVIGPCLPSMPEIMKAAKEDGNPVAFNPLGITQISDMNLILAYAEKVSMDWMEIPYNEISALVIEWCKVYKASYYSQCKEDFYVFEAFELAEKEGNKFVVTENLS